MARRNKDMAITHDADIWTRIEIDEHDPDWLALLARLREKRHEHERTAFLATYLGEVLT